jgi:hypothetical protein
MAVASDGFLVSDLLLYELNLQIGVASSTPKPSLPTRMGHLEMDCRSIASILAAAYQNKSV